MMKARSLALIATIAAALPLAAQQPMPGPQGPEMGPMAGASFLLSHTGDLQLTDQQVTRLAAIARREGARRRALRSTVDSLRRSAPARRDSAGAPRNRMIPPQLSNQLTQMREQQRTDLRDAITVLTPDQQAEAWQVISARGGRGGARMGQPGMLRQRMMQRRDRADGLQMGPGGPMDGRRGAPGPGQPGLRPRPRNPQPLQ